MFKCFVEFYVFSPICFFMHYLMFFNFIIIIYYYYYYHAKICDKIQLFKNIILNCLIFSSPGHGPCKIMAWYDACPCVNIL